MKIIYTLNGLYLWEVEEGSFMDMVLLDIIAREQERETQRLLNLIRDSKPISFNSKLRKDLLLDVERA